MVESLDALYDEMDFQGAVSAYLQTIPQMALYGSVKTNHYYGAVGNTDALLMYRDPSVDGMLTPNRVVQYLFAYPNLAESGPMVFEYPGGETAGIILDIQMRWLADLGVTSPFGSRPVKYLLLTVDQELPAEVNQETREYEVVRLDTNLAFFAYRVLEPERDTELARQTRIYPYAERENPPETRFFQATDDDDTYYMAQPVGMAYWEQLHEYLQVERVNEADRFMMARLKAVGIEKGTTFDPTPRQRAILERAALVGEKMALAITFAGRSDDARKRDDTNWVHVLMLNPSHRDGPIYQLEERVDFTFEAYGVSQAMKAGIVGEGSTYLGAYRDADGNWLEGGEEYVFRIAPDAPAARFWDLSVYRGDTRGLLPDVEGATSSINTFTEGLRENDDGSVDIYFGPGDPPDGYENNFVRTYEGMHWFAYFRLYGPTQGYFDGSWPMHDIRRVER